MALILYSNGIIEGYRPTDTVFSDEALYSIFDGFEYLVSSRLPDVANTWCLWGVMKDPPENEFNKIASEIVEQDVWSHLILIHDSELDPKWNVTDTILYKSYEEYTIDLGEFINGIVFELKQMAENGDAPPRNMIKLSAIGHTPDKRVIFEFDPGDQHEEFFDAEFPTFAAKIKDYLGGNFEENTSVDISQDNLIVFADNKTIVVVKHDNTDQIFSSMIDLYTSAEEYEVSGYLQSVQLKWNEYASEKRGYDKNGKIHKFDGKIASEKKIGRTKKKLPKKKDK